MRRRSRAGGEARPGPISRDIGIDVEAAGLGSIAHEMAHPLIEEDFGSAPEWLREGIASLYEQRPPMTTPGDIESTDASWRSARLRDALASKSERAAVTLSAVFAMTDADFEADDLWGNPSARKRAEDLHYAMARYACRWLDQQGKLWPFYHAWRDGELGDRRGEKAFAAVMGKTVDEASGEWVQWLKGVLVDRPR